MLFGDFKNRYPKANLEKFTFVNDSFGGYVKWKVNGTTIMSDDDPSGETWTENLSNNLKALLWKDLGIENKLKMSSFPKSLSITNQSYPIPGVSFDQYTNDVTKMLIFLNIYVSEKDSFTAPMKNIFKNQTVELTSGKEARAWLNKPNIRQWPQQLNMAVWCATAGCGIGLGDILNYPKVVKSFFIFHIYFTIRRIIYELKVPLPDEDTFSAKNNIYNKNAYNRLCAEFGLSNDQDFKGLNKPLADFRFKGGANHGVGDVFIDYGKGYVDKDKVPGSQEYQGKGGGLQNVRIIRNYDTEANIWPSYANRFSDDGGKKIDGNLISMLRNDQFVDFQYAWFIPEYCKGLTMAGLGRINRSIEAFVYCILGAQVNTRTSIVNKGGGGIETQQNFGKLFESTVIENDVAKSIQKYQLAVQESKSRLDLAVAPGVWLMPSNLIINTESIVGYNNALKRVTEDMKFGVNNSVNNETKTVGIEQSLGTSKVLLNTRPQPSIDKTQNKGKTEEKVQISNAETSSHQTNLFIFAIGGALLSWFLFR